MASSYKGMLSRLRRYGFDVVQKPIGPQGELRHVLVRMRWKTSRSEEAFLRCLPEDLEPSSS
jgi:hypothetical protein